jgi:hypothetical protein
VTPLRLYRSVPLEDGSVALEVPDDAVILANPANWCRRCNKRRVIDPKGVHVCAGCRKEPLPGAKGKRILDRERGRRRAA